MFQIILRETAEVIGDIGFHGAPDEAGTVEIGYSIVEQYRGRGLVGESAVAICGLVWSRPEVTRIIAQTEEGNAASAGVLRHAGFREDGVADGLRTSRWIARSSLISGGGQHSSGRSHLAETC